MLYILKEETDQKKQFQLLKLDKQDQKWSIDAISGAGWQQTGCNEVAMIFSQMVTYRQTDLVGSRDAIASKIY